MIKMLIRKLINGLPMILSRTILYYHRFHRFPRILKPKTFHEKLNYRILFDRRRFLVMASSKVVSKQYVESLNIPGLLVPRTLWTGTDVSELEGHEVDCAWVLKPSHRSGEVVTGSSGKISRAQLTLNVDEWLEEREYRVAKLWAYKQAPREILLEQRIGQVDSFPLDYKFFVFDGRVAMIQVDYGRGDDHTRCLYSPDWKLLPYNYAVPQGVPSPAPNELPSMLRIARTLGSGFDFIRVDLYAEGGEVFFGELTAYPSGGLSPWPSELDQQLGHLWQLPHRSHLRRNSNCSLENR